jgi:signal transduction histidine kinase
VTATVGGVDEGRLLLELTREVTSSLDLQDVLDKSLVALRRLIDFNGGSIQLIDAGALRMVAGDPPPTLEAFAFRLPIGQGFGGRVAETGEPLYSPDATVDQRAHPEGRRRASVAGTRSWFGAPLIVHGETIGIVQLDDLGVDHFPAPVQARVLAFLPIVSAAVQNALLYQQESDALARLQEAEGLKRDFVATVSHELKTPLTVVQGFANILATTHELLDVDQVVTIGQRIEAAAHRLEEIISDMLHISGIETGHLIVDLQPTTVASVMEQAGAEAERGTHKIEITAGPDLPCVLTDPARLQQILVKLLDNAHKFSPDNTAIRMAAQLDPEHVVVTIEDEGQGVPEDMRTRIFEPFVQLDSSNTRATGGMGTGLFLVQRICDAIGATVTMTSELDVGSRFAVHLTPTESTPNSPARTSTVPRS